MKSGEQSSKNPGSDMRKEAEERLRKKSSGLDGSTSADKEELFHELQVHQIELEIQNEELRRAQLQIEESRDRYANLYDFAPLSYFTVNEKGFIIEANLTATILLKIDRSTLLKKRFASFITKEDQDTYYFQRRNLIEGRIPVQFELRMQRNDGSPFYGRLYALVVDSSVTGSPVSRIAVSDITELKLAEEEVKLYQQQLQESALAQMNARLRREAEERKQALAALKKSEARYRLLAFNSSDMISRHSLDGKFNYVSPSSRTLLGYEPEELEGHSLNDFCHPDDLPALEIIQAGTMEKPGGTTATFRLRRKNGSYVWVESTSRVVRDEATGEGMEIQASTRDFSQRKRAEDRIHQQNLELGILNQISADASQSLELDEILEGIKKNLVALSGILAGSIYLYDSEAGSFQLKQEWHKNEAADLHLPVPHSTDVAELIKNQFAFKLLPTADRSDLHPAHKAPWVWGTMRVSLVAQGILLGVVTLIVKLTPGQMSARAGIIKLLTHEVSTAIFNAQLYQAEMQSRQFAETLRSASLALTRYLDLDSVLEKLLELTNHVVPFDRAVVYLYEDTNQVSAHLGRGFDQEEDREAAYSLRQDFFNRPSLNEAFHTRHSVSIPDVAADPHWQPEAVAPDLRSWAGVPLVAGDKIIGFCGLEKCEPRFFTPKYLRWAESLANQASVAIQNAWLFDQVRAGQERMQMLSRRLVEAQEKERSFVARELHDEAGQALVSLMLEIGALKKDASEPEAVLNHVKWLEENTAAVLENLHNLARDLRPATLDHLGLVAALRQYIESIEEQNKINIKFEPLGMEKRLPREAEISLYRIALEAITNVVRHAQARSIDIILEKEKEQVVLLVEDDGVGFTAGTELESDHLGLAGMRERAEMIGGTLTVESEPGQGTTVQLVLPI